MPNTFAAFLTASLVAQVPPANPPSPSVEETTLMEAMVELETQLDQMVVATTLTAVRTFQAPAVVTVINRDEIRTRGYNTLADALRTVPGFYDVYDGVFHNVGVRGFNSGVRAAGNGIKILIDGQAVAYRSTTANFFGEE